VQRVAVIGILAEVFRKHDLLGVRAAGRESVADYTPLRFTVEAETLSKIVNESSHYHPSRMAVLANRFGGLEQMLKLGKVCIRIAVVHERVQILCRLPDALLPASQSKVLLLFREHILVSLILVIQAVEFSHAWVRMLVVLTEFLLGLSFFVASFEKFVPLLHV